MNQKFWFRTMFSANESHLKGLLMMPKPFRKWNCFHKNTLNFSKERCWLAVLSQAVHFWINSLEWIIQTRCWVAKNWFKLKCRTAPIKHESSDKIMRILRALNNVLANKISLISTNSLLVIDYKTVNLVDSTIQLKLD